MYVYVHCVRWMTRLLTPLVVPNGSDTFQCGLRCEMTRIVWGDDESEFDLIARSFLICAVLFLALCAVVGVNVTMDITFHDAKCWRRGFLFHAPICIVILYAMMAICVLIPWVLGGSEKVSCSEDVDGVYTFGSLVIGIRHLGGIHEIV